MKILFIGLFLISLLNCSGSEPKSNENNDFNSEIVKDKTLKVGAERIELYFNLIENKAIGIVTNQTGTCKNKHLVDTLLDLGLNIQAVFSPEHGFRGTADAGARIGDSIDEATGLKIISLYGNNKKPKPEQLVGIEIMIFDIQDVGARFYTYISTLHYVMEACAESDIPLIVLDRPNPNGHYVDGPILDTSFRSFIGMHPIPIVHGMTIAEYAKMINGENWLPNGLQCELSIIPCENYTHTTKYSLPIPPSPNLPNDRSIELYPSICLFEGTCLSLGRGTNMQFQIIGHPNYKDWAKADFSFTPVSMPGATKPVLEGELCYGFDFTENMHPFKEVESNLNIEILIEAWKSYPDKSNFFTNSFRLLAGSNTLREQIENGMSEDEIRETWKEDLEKFKEIRAKYLIY
ncbi:MAG: DUF1343 domain-containing protein [Bacteroidales bacterium]|nr:DUF1343 domain-containing protein [Bacteroidales bacterium]